MVDRSDVRHGGPWRVARPRPLRGEFFSLGGLLAPVGGSHGSLAPWLLSAAVLLALASWDPVTSGGRFDAILVGLAAYELLIGLTQADGRQPVRVVARPAGRGGDS